MFQTLSLDIFGGYVYKFMVRWFDKSLLIAWLAFGCEAIGKLLTVFKNLSPDNSRSLAGELPR